MTERKECLPGIRRPSRLGAVWLSFRTRWMSKDILFAVALILLVIISGFPLFPHDTTSSALPMVRSPSAVADFVRVNRATAVFWIELFVALALSIQLSSTCSKTVTVLTPNAVQTHRLWISAAFFLLINTGFSIYIWIGCSILASTSLSMVWLVIFGLLNSLLRLLFRMSKRQIGHPLLILMSGSRTGLHAYFLFIPLFCLQAVLRWNFGEEIDWFLMGNYQLLAIGLVAGSIWSAFDFFSGISDLFEDLEASGIGELAFAETDERTRTELANSVKQSAIESGSNFGFRQSDRRLDRLIERLDKHERLSALELWRLLRLMSPAHAFFGLCTTVLIMGFFQFVFPRSWEISIPVPQRLVGLMIFQAIFSAALVVIPWRERLVYHELELLRPTNRCQWIARWFGEMLSFLAATQVAQCLVLSEFYTLGWLGNVSIGGLCYHLFLSGGLAGFVYSLLMQSLAITTKAQWPGLFAFGCPAVIASLWLTAGPPSDFEKRTAIEMILTITGLILLVGFGLLLAWRRWQNVEIGGIESSTVQNAK